MAKPTIKVGVTAWDGMAAASTPLVATGTRKVWWIEVNGQRIDSGVIQVRGKWGADFHTTMVEFVGVPEFVFLDGEGKEFDAETQS